MDTIHLSVRSPPTAPTRLKLSRLKFYWSALLEWYARAKLRRRLSSLGDDELRDIGITRGEIDYVVHHSSGDPRGIMK